MNANVVFDPKAHVDAQEMGVPFFHFSIDDVLPALIEVTDKNIPLFDHPMFSLLKEIHEIYGVHVGLYLFYQKEINRKVRNLTEVRDLKKELEEAGGWLYFAPHALDYDTKPFEQPHEDTENVFNTIYTEIDRFAGKGSYASWVRLHFYSESFEFADYFKRRGVSALFSTDRPAGSYRMPEERAQALLAHGHTTYENANFIRTQFRVEFFANDALSDEAIRALYEGALGTYGYIIIYTHEYEFDRPEIHTYVRKAFEILNSLGVKSLKRI